MNDQVLIPKSEKEENRHLSVEIDHDRLKHFFYMMHGEPGSRTKVFGGAILVTKNDIERLICSLIEQLRLAHVREFTIKVGVGFEKEIVEKDYDDFKSYAWSEPHKTTEIIIRINFLYEDYDSGNPLKHAFFLRISRQLNPGNFFQILASSDNEKLDNFESLMSPVFCRTDHINDELSKALINVVSDWHKGRKQPQLISASYKFAKKHKERLARLVHYSFPAVACVIMCVAAFKASVLMATSTSLMPTYISIVISGIFLNNFLTGYGNRRARKIFDHLKKISDEDVIFDVTQGDDKDYSERINENNKAFSSARSAFIWAMSQNIIFGVIASAIFELLK